VAVERMRREELLDLAVTVDLLTAARAFGIGRTCAYTLAKQNTFPCRVIRAGGRYVVTRCDLFRSLGITEPAV
jgi:hypothetical protein